VLQCLALCCVCCSMLQCIVGCCNVSNLVELRRTRFWIMRTKEKKVKRKFECVRSNVYVSFVDILVCVNLRIRHVGF